MGASFLLPSRDFLEGSLRDSLFANGHEHDVHSYAMQPCGKRRFAAKRPNPAEGLQKSFLGQVFGFRQAFQHAHAQSKNSAAVRLIEPFKRRGVALPCKSNGFGIRHVASLRLCRFSHKILPYTR
jgi:hypothetical protein